MRYFLQIRGGLTELTDLDGADFPDQETMMRAVVLSARELMGMALSSGVLDLRGRIDVEDETGHLCHSLAFCDAAHILATPAAAARVCMASHVRPAEFIFGSSMMPEGLGL